MSSASNSFSRRALLRMAVASGLGGVLFLLRCRPRTGTVTGNQATITDWCIAGPRFELPQRAILPRYRQTHPGADVRIVTGTWANFHQRVAVAIAGGATQYDIIFHDYSEVPALAETGGLAPLDDYLLGNAELIRVLTEDVPKNYQEVWRYREKLFGMPVDANTQLMYWRMDALEKAGIAPPETWDDVLESARELSHAGTYGIVVSAQRGISSFSLFASVLWSHGGELYDPETYEVKLDSEPTFRTLTIMKALMKYADPVSLNATNDEAIRSFGGGASLMAPCEWGGTGFTDPRFNLHHDDTGIRPVPRGSGTSADHVALLGGLGFILPASAQHKDAAFQWMKFVLSDDDEVERLWVENSGQPAKLSVLRRYAETNRLFGPLAEAIPKARPFPRIPEGPELKDRIGTQVSRVLVGEESPERAARQMQAQITDLFQRAGYR